MSTEYGDGSDRMVGLVIYRRYDVDRVDITHTIINQGMWMSTDYSDDSEQMSG